MFDDDDDDDDNDNMITCKTGVVRLHRMHEMQSIVTDVRNVCLTVCQCVRQSVCMSACLSRMHRMTPARLLCAGAKSQHELTN